MKKNTVGHTEINACGDCVRPTSTEVGSNRGSKNSPHLCVGSVNVQKVRVQDIYPYPNNPRKNDRAVDDVAASIEQCGYCSPIIVDENFVVLAGHTRLKAIKKLGWETCEVVVKEGMSEEQKKKYRILDNKTNELATWDEELLQLECVGLDWDGYDFGLLIADEDNPR